MPLSSKRAKFHSSPRPAGPEDPLNPLDGEGEMPRIERFLPRKHVPVQEREEIRSLFCNAGIRTKLPHQNSRMILYAAKALQAVRLAASRI